MEKHSSTFNFKRVGKAWIVSMLLVCLSLPVIESVNRAYRNRIYHFGEALHDFQQHRKETEVLILGASDMKRIDAGMLGVPAVNLAFENEDYLESYYKLRKLISDMPKLKVVVIPVNIFSFSSAWEMKYGLNKEYFLYRIIGLTDMFEIAGHVGIGAFEKKVSSWNILNLDSFEDDLTALKAHRMDQHLSWLSLSDRRMNADKYRKLHFESAKPVDPVMKLYFHKILELCGGRGVRVIALAAPLTREYLEAVRPIVNRQEIIELTRQKLDNNKAGIHFLDDQDRMLDQPEYFTDAIHLNREGSRIYTQHLADELKSAIR